MTKITKKADLLAALQDPAATLEYHSGWGGKGWWNLRNGNEYVSVSGTAVNAVKDEIAPDPRQNAERFTRDRRYVLKSQAREIARAERTRLSGRIIKAMSEVCMFKASLSDLYRWDQETEAVVKKQEELRDRGEEG